MVNALHIAQTQYAIYFKSRRMTKDNEAVTNPPGNYRRNPVQSPATA
jgi:hypothetical protein